MADTSTTATDTTDSDNDGIVDQYDDDPYNADTTTDEVDSAPDSTSTDSTDTSSDGDSRQPTETVAIGEPARDDGLTFKVVSLEPVSSVPRDYEEPITPKSGAKLVLATVIVKNNRSTTSDPFCGGGGSTLVDKDQRNFELMDEAISISGNEICGDGVAPGFRQTYRLLYEMPADARTEGIALWNGDSDDSGGDSYVFVDK